MRLLIVADVAGHDGEVVMKRGRGDDQIGLGKGMAGLAAVFDQEPPLEHDILGDREHALIEHWPHLVGEPVVELGPPVGVGDKFDAEPDFGEARRADVEQVQWLGGDKAWREGRLEHDAMKLNHLRHQLS